MEWVNWVIAAVTALFVKFIVEDPIETAILNGFKISFAQNPDVVTFIELLEFAIAIGVGIWVYRLISSHPH